MKAIFVVDDVEGHWRDHVVDREIWSRQLGIEKEIVQLSSTCFSNTVIQ